MLRILKTRSDYDANLLQPVVWQKIIDFILQRHNPLQMWQ